MTHNIELKYYNPGLQVGLKSIKEVYLLSPSPMQLHPEVYRCKLVYRARGSAKRISYDTIKKGLVKKTIIIKEERPAWL